MKLLFRNGSRHLLTLVAVALCIASLGLVTPASAAVPDGDNCWWVAPGSPPSKSDTYSGTAQCDGPVDATPASAAVPDGHICWWVAPGSPPSKTDAKTVNYSATVQCDGPVRRIDLTVELLYHGLVLGPGVTVSGRTEVWQNTTVTPVFGIGAPSPGAVCESGYYSGRATATVQYLSGYPEFITRSTGSDPVLLDCPPPDLPTPSPAMTVVNPGTQVTFLPDSVMLQMQATGGSGSYTWSATGLPPGLTIGTTGWITGTPHTVGSYNVTVTAVGGGQASTTFTWRVQREVCPTC
ncbi:Ig domain-containing protein [Sinosporangium siamense]|uniref:Ig domain-containing protein n=1 Tax=Sinosporangium siamense TaxID=1367973 RepID=UPI001EF31175|nr:Ig domain-containing protein [Sinosporangium siamense]